MHHLINVAEGSREHRKAMEWDDPTENDKALSIFWVEKYEYDVNNVVPWWVFHKIECT